MTLVKKSLICVGGVFLEGGLQVKVTFKMVEIEVPNLQDWRSTSDGPLHVVFLVHLVRIQGDQASLILKYSRVPI